MSFFKKVKEFIKEQLKIIREAAERRKAEKEKEIRIYNQAYEKAYAQEKIKYLRRKAKRDAIRDVRETPAKREITLQPVEIMPFSRKQKSSDLLKEMRESFESIQM